MGGRSRLDGWIDVVKVLCATHECFKKVEVVQMSVFFEKVQCTHDMYYRLLVQTTGICV